MAWFADGAPCTYFGVPAERLVAIGWLDAPHPYVRGEVAAARLARLEAMLDDDQRAQPIVFRGRHACTLCTADEAEGHGNLFLVDGDRMVIAPELIGHYIRDHGYAPPDDFWRVLDATERTGRRATRAAVWTFWHQLAPPDAGRELSLWQRFSRGPALEKVLDLAEGTLALGDAVLTVIGTRVLLELIDDDEIEIGDRTYWLRRWPPP